MERSGFLASQSMRRKSKTEGQTASLKECGLEVAQIVIDLWPKLGDKTWPYLTTREADKECLCLGSRRSSQNWVSHYQKEAWGVLLKDRIAQSLESSL